LISQSGESAETKKAALALAGKGSPPVVVVNDEASSMARAASLVLPMKAGAEKSISNKTYLNTLGVMHLLAGGSPPPWSGWPTPCARGWTRGR